MIRLSVIFWLAWLLFVGLIWRAHGEEGPQIPDEATKKCALLKAYHMNGDSMVRWGSIDLSKDKDPCPKTIRVIPMTPDKQPKGKLG